MPFAQHHYPFENQDLFEQQFPAQFISEAVDQTRGWVAHIVYKLLKRSGCLRNPVVGQIIIHLTHDGIQPIADMFVKAPYKLDGYYQDIIRDELNVSAWCQEPP